MPQNTVRQFLRVRSFSSGHQEWRRSAKEWSKDTPLRCKLLRRRQGLEDRYGNWCEEKAAREISITKGSSLMARRTHLSTCRPKSTTETNRNASRHGALCNISRLLTKSSILSQTADQSSSKLLRKSKKLRLMPGTERHRSVHLLDSTVVRTTCCAGRKERTPRRSSSGRALSRSRIEPPPARARLTAAPAIAVFFSAAKRRGRKLARTSEAFVPELSWSRSPGSLRPPPISAYNWRPSHYPKNLNPNPKEPWTGKSGVGAEGKNLKLNACRSGVGLALHRAARLPHSRRKCCNIWKKKYYNIYCNITKTSIITT